MKKGLLALLLAAALAAPVFAADEGTMELDIKAGFNLMSSFKVESESRDIDPAFTAGVDFFYYVMPQLAIGGGISYFFNSKVDAPGNGKVGSTNLYAQAKYVFETGDDIFNNIYPLVQIGYGMLRVDPDDGADVDGGLYWGIGAGTTINKCVVLELLYSNGNGEVTVPGGYGSADLKHSTVQLKVGYKFTF